MSKDLMGIESDGIFEGIQKKRHLNEQRNRRGSVRKWIAKDAAYASAGSITMGLSIFFLYVYKIAPDDKTRNTVLSARFVLEQYIQIGMEQGYRVFATDNFMIRLTGMNNRQFQDAKKWLKEMELISVIHPSKDKTNDNRSYISINCKTEPDLKNPEFAGKRQIAATNRAGFQPWEVKYGDQLQNAVDSFLQSTAYANEKLPDV